MSEANTSEAKMSEQNPHYKFTYFNLRGLGESARLILAHAAVDYERVDIPFDDAWQEQKPNFPFGQLPVLEVDGKTLTQSIAICRYLGTKFGLLADDDWNNAQADSVALTILDLVVKCVKYFYETDEAIKKETLNDLETNIIPFYYSRLNDILKKDGHFAGKLTWVDFNVTGLIECIDGFLQKNTTENYPFIAKLKDTVLSLPNVKEYIANRPFNPVHDFNG